MPKVIIKAIINKTILLKVLLKVFIKVVKEYITYINKRADYIKDLIVIFSPNSKDNNILSID